jgi:hypothetical protein
LIKQLSSPIAVKNAQPALMKAFSETPEQFASKDLAVFTHAFMASFVVPPDVRAFLIKLFGKVALVDPPQRPKIDEAKAALVRAQIWEFLKGSKAATFSEIKISTVKLAGAGETTVCGKAVEVYLSDDEFKTAAKMTKDAFYRLGEGEMETIRAGLVKKGG